jgi:serine/threonine protein kinase
MPEGLQERLAAAIRPAYEIEAEIGRGGMGVVYRCLDLKLRRRVAIKVLPPELAFREDVRTRFLREAETAAQLSHPNIVPIYAVDDRDGITWFVMGLVDGESLGAELARIARPPLPEVLRVLHDVADALAYAHARGIVHRDIKPDNILLERGTGRPMVTDFGIARAIEASSRLTVTGSAVGTPAYMSPEQATGEREIDGRSDMYSLAVVGYQMLSGELPFQASNTPSMLMKHISEPLRPLRLSRLDIPVGLAAVVERALAKKPGDRWASAAEFRDELAAIDLGRQQPVPPSSGHVAPQASIGWQHAAVAHPALPSVPPAIDLPPVRLPRLTSDSRSSTPGRPRGARGAGRSAIEAANPGWRDPDATPLPPLPPWMPPSWREARREWRRQRRDMRLAAREARHRGEGVEHLGQQSLAWRIRAFRRRLASSTITIGMLAAINLMFTPEFPWFLIPALFMSLGLLNRGASLWADGIRFRDVFGREAREKLLVSPSGGASPAGVPRLPSISDLAAKLAPTEVLEGRYGDLVRRAASDQSAAREAIQKLSPADRQLIPDVSPTIDALAERVGALAFSLHRLDEDVTPDALAALDRRIAEARTPPGSPDREKTIALLERQRATLADLLGRREVMTAQLESASLMLQNMRLDLLALRSAGVQSVLNDVTSATQEARALSRDIQIALEAAREIR